MRQSRVKGAISLVMAQAIVLMLGYGMHLWIGRVLGPGPYGIYGVVLSVQIIVGLFLTLGVPSAVSRFVAQDEKHSRSILSQALAIQTVIAAVLAGLTVVFAPIISGWLNDVSLVPFLRFTAVVIFLQAFYPVYVQYLSGLHYFNKQAALTAIYAMAKLAGAILLLYAFGVFGAFAGFAVGGLVAVAFGWYWTRRAGGQEYKRLQLTSFLSFAGTMALILAGLQLLMSLDLFMVKSILKDDIQAGYYNASVTLSRIPYALLQALAFILLPSVSVLTKPGANREAAVRFIKDTLRYLIALIIPGAALAAATSQQLITLFYSESFLPAAPSLSVLMIGLCALAFFLLLSYITAGAGRARISLCVLVAMIAMSAMTGLQTIPRFGLVGAAWQTTLAALLGLAVLSAYTFKAFRLPLPVKSTLNVLLATVVIVLPTYVWLLPAALLPVEYVVLLVLYVGILYLLGEITPDDRRRLASIHPALRWLQTGHYNNI